MKKTKSFLMSTKFYLLSKKKMFIGSANCKPTKYDVNVMFRDGMKAQVRQQNVDCSITINELCKHGDAKMFSRVGLMTMRNQKQNVEWFWMVNRERTLESYIVESKMNSNDNINIAFFK